MNKLIAFFLLGSLVNAYAFNIKTSRLSGELSLSDGQFQSSELELSYSDISLISRDISAQYQTENQVINLDIDNFKFLIPTSKVTFLKDNELIQFEELNFILNPQKSFLEAHFIGHESDSKTHISTPFIDCLGVEMETLDLGTLLGQCFIQGQLRVQSVLLTEKAVFVENLFHQLDFLPLVQDDTKFKDIHFSFQQNNFNGSVKIDLIADAKVKLGGHAYYHKEASEIEVIINKAKVGFLSVRSRLLKELAKMEGLRVEGNSVFIEL